MKTDIKKAVIAPDSFKGTLTSIEVCEIIKSSLEEKYPNIVCEAIPVADGGEGTVDAFLYALGGQRIEVKATDPIGREIKACYALLKDTAVIETSAASGLPLLEEKAPMNASTFGTGELLLDALDRGVRKIIIGLGGSATTDGGTGFLTALGASFLTSDGEKVTTGERLGEIKTVDLSGLDERLGDCEITALCDVTNPLFGKNGAAYVFAPQKGADSKQVEFLDKGLMHFAKITADALGYDKSLAEGSGAAGGLGFALLSYLSAEFKSGAETVLEICEFKEKLKNADIVITGEGRLDSQSLQGKVPFTVAKMSLGVPVTAIVGVSEISLSEAKAGGIDRVIETNEEGLPFEEVKKRCRIQLKEAADKI